MTVTITLVAQPDIVYTTDAVPKASPLTALPLIETTPLPVVLQAPPATVSASMVVVPTHTLNVPVIVAGAVFIVIILVTMHPVPREYVITLVPVPTPFTRPLREPTVAAKVLLLLHVPPPEPFERVIVSLAHKADPPIMGPGERLIVTDVTATHPAGEVYLITSVPVVTPVTAPVDPTVAMLVVMLTQVPPAGLPLSVMIAPTHSAEGPVITGMGFTVTTVDVLHPAV